MMLATMCQKPNLVIIVFQNHKFIQKAKGKTKNSKYSISVEITYQLIPNIRSKFTTSNFNRNSRNFRVIDQYHSFVHKNTHMCVCVCVPQISCEIKRKFRLFDSFYGIIVLTFGFQH